MNIYVPHSDGVMSEPLLKEEVRLWSVGCGSVAPRPVHSPEISPYPWEWVSRLQGIGCVSRSRGTVYVSPWMSCGMRSVFAMFCFGFENRRAMHCTFLRLWLWFAMAALPHGCCGNNRPTPAALLASVHDGVFDALHHVWRCGEAFVVSIQAPGVRCDDIAGFKLVRREQTTAPLTVLYADTKDGVRMRWAVRGQHRLFQTSLRSARMDLQSGSPSDGRSLLVPVCSQNGMGVHLFVNWVTVEVC